MKDFNKENLNRLERCLTFNHPRHISQRHPRTRRPKIKLHQPTAIAHHFHRRIIPLRDDLHHVITRRIQEANEIVDGVAQFFVICGDEEVEVGVGDGVLEWRSGQGNE